MRFNEFSKITEDMKLPPEKTRPHFTTPADAAAARAEIKADLNKLGSYKPGSEPRFPWEKSDTVSKATAPSKPATSATPAKAPGLGWSDITQAGRGTAFPSGMPLASASPGAVKSMQQGIQGAKRAGAGSDVNTYAGAGGSFMDQQYLKDLQKALDKDPTNKNYQDEIQNIQNRIATNQGSNDALQRTLGSKFQNPSANNAPASAQPSTSTPPNLNEPKVAPTAPAAPAVQPTASTGTSAPAQSAYKGSSGAQAIQQANPDKIADVNKIRAGDTIKVGGQDYTIKPGDTLDAIARSQLSTPSSAPATTAPTAKSGSDSEFRQADMDRMKQMAATTSPEISKESTTSLNRIKSLAGLK